MKHKDSLNLLAVRYCPLKNAFASLLSSGSDISLPLAADIWAAQPISAIAAEFTKQLDIMTERMGAAKLATEKMTDTVDSQWQLFKNQFNKTLQDLGGNILPAVTEGFKAINDFDFSGMATLNKEFQELAKNAQDTAIELGRIGEAFREEFGEGGKAKPPPSIDPLVLTEAEKRLEKIFKIKQAIQDKDVQARLVQQAMNELSAEGFISLDSQQKASEAIVRAKEVELEKQEEINEALEDAFSFENEKLELTEAQQKALDKTLATQRFMADTAMLFADEMGRALTFTQGIGDAIKNIIRSLASRAITSGIFAGIASLTPLGASASFGSLFAKSFLGFASGGTILPSGSGTTDSQFVAFRKRPDEQVDITTPGQRNDSRTIILEGPSNAVLTKESFRRFLRSDGYDVIIQDTAMGKGL